MQDADIAHRFFSLLNGKKHLIRGNHDKFIEDFEEHIDDVVWIKDYYVLNYQKRKFVLFHYPILEWEGNVKDSIHIYNYRSGKTIKMTILKG